MRLFPAYAYPNFPHGFYAPPAEASLHRPHRPHRPSSTPAPSAPTPRSVINVPVFDTVPMRPSTSPPQSSPAAVPFINPSAAATTIQSHFRGFCVRRHQPLLHLRSIATARKQLEEIQIELKSPGYTLKLRASEKERLRFSERVMAIILRLDAVEGSMAEVRSERKEVTKMAIKLQDAIDAFVMQKDEIPVLDQTAGGDAIAANDCGSALLSGDSALLEQPQEPIDPDIDKALTEIDMVHREVDTVLADGNVDVNKLQEKQLSPKDEDAKKSTPNHASNNAVDIVAENMSPSHPCEKVLDEWGEAGLDCARSQVEPSIAICNSEQDISYATGGNAGSDVPHVANEGEDGIDAFRMETQESLMENDVKVDQKTCMADMRDAGNIGSVRTELTDGLNTRMDAAQEGIDQDNGVCLGAVTVVEENSECPDYGDATHGKQLHYPLTSLERLTEGKCASDEHSNLTLRTCRYEERSVGSDEANSSDEGDAQGCPLSEAKKPFVQQDSAIIHQLSEDCGQLKSLVSKLLVQNKAQSNLLQALADRLETLEHQQRQLNCRHYQQKMREKRKLRKGSKRSVKCQNWEW